MITQALNTILSFTYPSFCRSCQTLVPQNNIFCCSCYEKIKPIVSLMLPITKKHHMKVFAASAYQEPLKSLILKKAFSEKLASKQLAEIILKKIGFNNINPDVLIPIPLHWTRYANRGYNQSEIMSKYLGKNFNKPSLNILKRTRKTQFQSCLKKEQKKENVRNAFEIKYFYKTFKFNIIKDKNILIIDDLCTSGSTLQNAAKVLFKLKPKSINAIVACRVI
ncbi:hypothetical protein GF322_03325 [Candidatus Dependentiae bacterium]|nr:hypothetical protein [Candidatus Dependentiae bacterium]